MKYLHVLFLILAVGCQTVQPPQLDTTDLADHWQVSGRIAIQAVLNEEPSHVQASFDWQQEQHHFQGILQGPFGMNRTIVRGNHKQITLEFSDGEVVTGTAPDVLLAAKGLPALPLRHFEHWILGQPAPETSPTQMVYDTEDVLRSFQQHNWQITIQAYRGRLPQKLQLLGPNHLKINLVLYQWSKPVHSIAG